MATKILIVDDSPVLRKTLRRCLELNSDWEVCGEAENGVIALEKVELLNPDLVILDLAMPLMNGLEAARKISAMAPRTITVLFTMQDATLLVSEASAAGIAKVFSKSAGAKLLMESLTTLLSKN